MLCLNIAYLASVFDKKLLFKLFERFKLIKFSLWQLTPMEARKRRMRRERNKIAAAKCRDRRRLLTDQLEGETQLLSNQHQHLKYQQYQLEKEKKHLQHMLDDHVRGSKCRLINSDVIMPEQGDVILHEASAFSSFVAPPPDAPMQLPGFSGATSAFEQRHRADEKSGGENSHVNSMLKLLWILLTVL